MKASPGGRVRLDKWLWAARFFKTRALARAAVEGGKVHYNGARTKPGREVSIGAEIEVPRGADRMRVVVCGLAEQRRSAAEAASLYTETEASVQARETAAEQRRRAGAARTAPATRPDKKQRRRIIRFQRLED